MELKRISPEEIRELCKDPTAIAQAQLKKVVEWLDLVKVGEFNIVKKQFVEGEPNCIIFTQIDWQALLKEAGKEVRRWNTKI